MNKNIDILNTIKTKHLVTRLTTLIICLFLSACLFNIFILPNNLVIGGTNGIAIITNYLYGIPPSIIILLISILLLILSFIFLGTEITSGSIIATLIYPIFVSITAPISNYVNINTTDLLVTSIFIGVISGVINGLIYKTGFSNGGLPIVSQILYKKHRISISKTSFMMNSVIVILGSIFFGLNNLMYALIILYINSIMIDRVLLGISNNKAFYIITDETKKVKEYIIDKLHYTTTEFSVVGGFLEKKKKVLFTVVPTRDYIRLIEKLKEIDNNLFFVVYDAYQVQGVKKVIKNKCK